MTLYIGCTSWQPIILMEADDFFLPFSGGPMVWAGGWSGQSASVLQYLPPPSPGRPVELFLGCLALARSELSV